MNLISAQISFLEPHLALIHIPIELYSLCLQPILRLLFGEDHDEDAAKISWTNRHDFLNISITPIECSIICSRYLAERYLSPLSQIINQLYDGKRKSKSKTEIQISSEDYIVIQVDGQGLDAGQRVLELTSPLAMAGISIFFITTYFSDYILVPLKSQRTVTKALQQRGFVFSQTIDAFVSQISPSSPILPQGSRTSSSSSPFHDSSVPTTPPAEDIPELQIRTFTKLKRHSIQPMVDDHTRLANCAGSREYNQHDEERLKNDLLQVLLATAALPEQPQHHERDPTLDFGARFLSVTITSAEPISILLEHRLLPRLGSFLLGAKSDEDALIPIILDLRDLPLEATGIVCGVAGRLAQGHLDVDKELHDVSPGSAEEVGNDGEEAIEISFLSTVRAGTVIVRANQLERAMGALEVGMKRVQDA